MSEYLKQLEAEYDDVIINKEVAENTVDENTLLIIVDTHKQNYVEVPSLIEKTNKIDKTRMENKYTRQFWSVTQSFPTLCNLMD